MLRPAEHTKRLRRFEVDRLIKIIEIEALKHHKGCWGLLRFSTHYKVAFGTPEIHGPSHKGYIQVLHMPAFRELKDALIHALVTGKTFQDYFDDDPCRWFSRNEDGWSLRWWGQTTDGKNQAYSISMNDI